MPERTCLRCSAAFEPKRVDSRFCSRQCSSKYFLDSPTKTCTTAGCDRPLRAKGLCGMHYKRANAHRRTRYEVTCATCEQFFLSSQRDGKFCSDECKGVWYSDTLRTKCKLPDHHPVMTAIRQERDAAKASVAERKARGKYAWRIARECPGCGCWFTPLYTPNTIACSARCSRRIHRRRRRAREVGARGSWVWSDFMRIAHKFDYCCAYCGEKPARLDPDHVVPLARGGYDSATNLLPACPPCNTSKHARTLDEWATWRAERGLPPRQTNWSPDDKRFTHLTQALLAAA